MLAPSLQESLLRWRATGVELPNLKVNLQVQELSGTELGFASIDRLDRFGRPAEVTVTVDDNGGRHGWYIDATPSDDTEFFRDQTGALISWTPEATGRFDVLSVLQHELGHLFGFTQSFDGFQGLVLTDAYGRQYVDAGESRLWLDTSGNELSYQSHASRLMASNLQPGIRKHPSLEESFAINRAQQSAQYGFNSHAIDGELNGSGNAFIPVQEAINRAGVPSLGLKNSRFNSGTPETAGFSWSQVGSVQYGSGLATLTEFSTSMVSDLSQTFVMPSPLDVLSVINAINRQYGEGEEELGFVDDSMDADLLELLARDQLIG